MTPVGWWLSLCIGGALYHGAKHILGFSPSWDDYFHSVYWVGCAMALVHYGWVRI